MISRVGVRGGWNGFNYVAFGAAVLECHAVDFGVDEPSGESVETLVKDIRHSRVQFMQECSCAHGFRQVPPWHIGVYRCTGNKVNAFAYSVTVR